MAGMCGGINQMAHNFTESLAMSHAAEDLPVWEEVYRAAFPNMVAFINHRDDGQHQRNGIDRSVILNNAKQIWIDEKVRGRNKKTGKVYTDIALEYLSDSERGVPGWVCKPLLCDYIAYAIAPIGKCYLLPVPQLQQAWQRHRLDWVHRYREVKAHNRSGNREWWTLSVPVPANVLFAAIGACLRVEFTPFEVA